jgi:hypothetical protein
MLVEDFVVCLQDTGPLIRGRAYRIAEPRKGTQSYVTVYPGVDNKERVRLATRDAVPVDGLGELVVASCYAVGFIEGHFSTVERIEKRAITEGEKVVAAQLAEGIRKVTGDFKHSWLEEKKSGR